MLVHLSTVEDVFELRGGLSVTVVPGIPRECDWRVRVGDPITLERPDGSKLESTVTGIEMPRPAFCNPLMIGNGLTKRDVPIGTKLWVAQKRA